MESGRLRQRVQIQAASESLGGFGDAVQTWTTVATRWASVEPLSGRELWQAQQVQSDVTHKVTLRPAGLTVSPKMRIVHKTRTLSIQSVRDVEERGIALELMCVEET